MLSSKLPELMGVSFSVLLPVFWILFPVAMTH